MVLTDCSPPPTLPRPPEFCCCTRSNAREISPTVAECAISFVGSAVTRTSLVTPPIRSKRPTPPTLSSVFPTTSSTNQERASSSIAGISTAYVRIASLLARTALTVGCCKSLGRLDRTRSIASLVSIKASEMGLPSSNSTEMLTAPSVTSVLMCLTLSKVAKESSILRATSVSSCAGAAPGCERPIRTTGMSTSGRS
ncbi:hypothetical protein D3C71_862220 [compost metagenome]